ncbi:MAG: hypothetical protein JJT85_00400 [Chromatiales bacterium]|nr:hypothetical protein [Chromatiales bacterium]
MSRAEQRALALLLTALVLSGTSRAVTLEQWRCEALRGTAYEFSPERDHWLTRVFPVEEKYILRREVADQSIWTISPADGEGDTLPCGEYGQPDWLACAGAGGIRVDLATATFSVSLPPIEGQVGRTAAGRCLRTPELSEYFTE